MSILSLFDIGRTTLLTTRRALDATAHNVANSATPGYTRQDVTLSSIPGSDYSNIGSIGRGVTVGAVQRMYDSFTSLQLITEKSNLAYWNSYQSGSVKMENIFNEASDTGVYPAIADFFNAWQEVSQNPEGYAQRTLLLSKADYLADRLNRASTALYDLRAEVYTNAQTSVREANEYISRIADLNEKIASNPGALDLKDQRDQLLEQLNEIVKVSTFTDNQGRYNILVGGTPLVDGGNHYDLSVSLQNDAMQFAIELPSGPHDVTSLIQAGELKASIDLRERDVVSIQNKLNVFAIDLAAQVNYYHRIGYGLDGSTNNTFFNNTITNIDPFADGRVSVSVNTVNAGTFDQYRITYNVGGPGQQEGASGLFWRIEQSSDNGATWNDISATAVVAAEAGAADPTYRNITFNGMTMRVDANQTTLIANVPKDTYVYQLNANAAREISLAVSDPQKVAAAGGDYVVVSSGNNVIRMSENGGTSFISASIQTGTYTRQQLAAALQTALENADPAGAQGYTVAYNQATQRYTIGKTAVGSTTVFDWTSTTTTASGLFGFNALTNVTSVTPATSAQSVYPQLPGDNANAAILSGLFNQAIVGGAKPADFYQSIVSDIGVQTSTAETSKKFQETLVQQLEVRRQEISGVNMDEEAANMIKYQKSYQAAAKMISIADEMLTTLLNMTGR